MNLPLPIPRHRLFPFAMALGLTLVLGLPGLTIAAEHAATLDGSSDTAHPVPGLLWTAPFILLLLAIATLPLIHHVHHWWERNSVKLGVGLVLGVIVLLHYATRDFGFHHAEAGWPSVKSVIGHAVLEEYIPFIVLLFSLYVIAGGLQLRGDLLALPSVNTGFLALGALLASFVGTTGASMVLIRPLLQTNRDRKHVKHTVIFFIFLVSNIGGCLLPIGDPPLFLGYLQGVPFLWTLHLTAPWAFSVLTLLAVYYVWDRFFAFPREPEPIMKLEEKHYSPLRLHGTINLFWLVGVVLSVALIVPHNPLPGTQIVVGDFVREGVMLFLTACSLLTTPRGLRKEVEFSYAAILEVAALFLGIFLTMQVPIEILQANGKSLGLQTPMHFFWSTGLLSSFLDNAPTYVVFFETAKTLDLPSGALMVSLTESGHIGMTLLKAISLGAVFMGANTYIGNGPNFMVKSIAEAHRVRMPGFFGYMAYSITILIPLFVVVSLLFFA